jgi:hypothetical protein
MVLAWSRNIVWVPKRLTLDSNTANITLIKLVDLLDIFDPPLANLCHRNIQQNWRANHKMLALREYKSVRQFRLKRFHLGRAVNKQPCNVLARDPTPRKEKRLFFFGFVTQRRLQQKFLQGILSNTGKTALA